MEVQRAKMPSENMGGRENFLAVGKSTQELGGKNVHVISVHVVRPNVYIPHPIKSVDMHPRLRRAVK